MREKPIVSTDAMEWAARQVVRMHREPATDYRVTGSCAQCPPGGPCPLLAWAEAILPGAGQDGWFVAREDEETSGGPMSPHEGYSLGGRFRPIRT